jgi:dTDP-4-dehydrorhamnose reductase
MAETTPSVLIVGASGFVGRHTLRLMRRLGWPVVGTQTRARGGDLVEFDLVRDRLVERVGALTGGGARPTHVVICAAMAQPDRCFRERELSYQVNVVRTIQLIDDVVALGAQPVYMTSGFVFDGTAGYYGDDEQRWPLNEYGRHKAEVEVYCTEHHPGMLLLRLDKIIGDDPSETHMFSEWYRWYQEGRPVVCMADQLFSPTDVRDVSQAIRLGCERSLSGLYNIANPEFFTREELARQFFRILGLQARIQCKTQEELNFLDLRPEKTYLDSSRFQRDTGLRFTSVRETIHNFIENLKRTPLPSGP